MSLYPNNPSLWEATENDLGLYTKLSMEREINASRGLVYSWQELSVTSC